MTTLDDAELERIAKEILKSEPFSEYDRGLLTPKILKALKQIRDARLVGPSEEEFVNHVRESGNTPAEAYNWLCSQLRLETKARVSDEELEKFVTTLGARNREVGIKPEIMDMAEWFARLAYRAAENRLLGEDRCKLCGGGIGWSERRSTGEYDPDICKCEEK